MEKRSFIIVSGSVAALVLIGVGVYLLRTRSVQDGGALPSATVPGTTTANPVQVPAGGAETPSAATSIQPVTDPTAEQAQRDYIKTLPVDTDADGLSDAEEKTLSTDPKKADTDGDMLTDYQEVVMYKTNPLVQDSEKAKLIRPRLPRVTTPSSTNTPPVIP